MTLAGERRHRSRNRGWGWIRRSRAVLSVVVGQVGTEGVAGDELRGGDSFGSIWGFWPGWFSAVAGVWAVPQDEGELGGGVGWTGEALFVTKWTGMWRRPSRSGMGKTTCFSSIASHGSSRGIARGCLRTRLSSETLI